MKKIFHKVCTLTNSFVHLQNNSKRLAFTLAEVLITLAVIGVVTAITLPTVVANITEKMNNEREKNIVQKITKSMEQMRALGLLNQTYDSTESFVDDLQKHLKIAKRCDKDHIAECWSTQTVINGDGNEVEVKTAKKGKNIKLSTNTNNVGLILADGASIILNYNPSKGSIDVGDEVRTSDDGYTTSVTKNIAFIMDVNGGKSPNSEVSTKKRDVRSFNGARFAGCPGEMIDGICYKRIDSYNPINTCDDKTWDSAGSNNGYCADNYWAGAKVACDDIGMELIDKDTALNNFGKYGNKLGIRAGIWTSSNDCGRDSNSCANHHFLGQHNKCYQKARFYTAVCVIK